MRSSLLSLALGVTMLAGCFGGGAPAPAAPVQSGAVLAYRSVGTGTVGVAVPAALRDLTFLATDTGFHGAEPTVGVTPGGTVFAVAYEQVLRSRDGLHWESVHQAALGQSFDPMLWVDTETGRVFTIHIFPERTCSTISTSDDEGGRWSDRPLVCPNLVVDHQKLATGPAVGPLAGVAQRLDRGRLTSLCYNSMGTTHCAVSSDGGTAFGQDVPVDGLGTGVPVAGSAVRDATGSCGGLNGHQHHAADGTIYLPYGYACQESRIAVSTDGGATWTLRAPRQGEKEIDPEISSTPDGTAYYLYRGEDQRMHLLRSRDRFATFEGPYTVSPPEVKGTVFAGLAAGSDGRVAVAYLGNRQSAAGPDDVPARAVWSLYAAVSLDANAAAPTFATVQVTPDSDPLQRGSICHSKECVGGNRNLLDFIDLSLGPDGRPWIAVVDGCTSRECHLANQFDVGTSRDDNLVVAHLERGPSLWDDKATLAPLE